MPAFRETREPWGPGRAFALTRPAASLAAAADALAGYVIASPAVPHEEEALAVVPFIFASAGLLTAAGNVFARAFGRGALGPAPLSSGNSSDGPRSASGAPSSAGLPAKRVFLLGSALALGGLFAAMGAALSAGSLPVYLAAFLFLVTWARAGRGAELALAGPVSGGMARALSLALGMSAHSEIVYFTGRGALLAPGLFFVYGALVEAVEGSLGEGGRRYLLVGALLGCLAVFGGSAAVLARTALARIVALTGAVFLAARGASAVKSLLPADVRRFGEGAILAGFFLDSGLCFGRWEASGVVLVLGVVAVALVVPSAMMLPRSGRKSAAPGAPAG